MSGIEVTYMHGEVRVATVTAPSRLHADADAEPALRKYVSAYNAKHRRGDALRVSDLRGVEASDAL